MSDLSIDERLKNGARLLGKLLHSGVKCSAGWSGMVCSCRPRNRFCEAKAQWVAMKKEQLAARGENIRDIVAPEHPCAIALLMSIDEFEAAAITMPMTLPGRGDDAPDVVLRVGAKGQIGMRELRALSDIPDALSSVMNVLSTFPGSRVVEASKA
jgi:hypothetical protein